MSRVIAIAAVLLLSIPSAMGVQAALTPSRGAIAGWKVPNGLTGAEAFVQSFDWLLLALSVAESAPLSGLAFAIALILHNLNHRSKISRQTPLTTRRSVV